MDFLERNPLRKRAALGIRFRNVPSITRDVEPRSRSSFNASRFVVETQRTAEN